MSFVRRETNRFTARSNDERVFIIIEYTDYRDNVACSKRLETSNGLGIDRSRKGVYKTVGYDSITGFDEIELHSDDPNAP